MRVLLVPNYARHQTGYTSSRYRVYNYLGFLAEHGIASAVVEPPQRSLADKWTYVYELIAHAVHADVVFIQKKLLPPLVFAVLRFVNPRLVFDFDDALFVANPGDPESGRDLQWVKPRLDMTLRSVCHVVAGNHYLAEYAAKLNPHVSIIPTPIDLRRFSPRRRVTHANGLVTVGWTGSGKQHLPHLALLTESLTQLAKRTALRVKLIGTMGSTQMGELYASRGIPVECVDWIEPSAMPDAIAEFDIGVMPLVDDAWARGKCGLKALEYMALGVPTVVSPVGINAEIISDGENGFTAKDPDEWFERLWRLATDADLRMRIGAAGRKTVETRFSLEHTGEKLIRVFEETVAAFLRS